MLWTQAWSLFGFLASLWGCGASTSSCDLNLGTTNDGAEREVSDTATLYYAQSFQLSTAATDIASVEFYVYKGGTQDFSSGDSLNVYIADDDSGSPSLTSKVANSEVTIDYEALNRYSSTPQYQKASFSSNVSLAASTTYWVVLEAGYGATTDHYVVWRGYSTNEYANGKAKEQASGTWADVPDDGTKTPASMKDFLIKVGCD